jgi:hypothetical protein
MVYMVYSLISVLHILQIYCLKTCASAELSDESEQLGTLKQWLCP